MLKVEEMEARAMIYRIIPEIIDDIVTREEKIRQYVKNTTIYAEHFPHQDEEKQPLLANLIYYTRDDPRHPLNNNSKPSHDTSPLFSDSTFSSSSSSSSIASSFMGPPCCSENRATQTEPPCFCLFYYYYIISNYVQALLFRWKILRYLR